MCQAPRIDGTRRFHGRDGPGSLCKNQLKQTKEFADLRACDDEWRQQAQSKIVRAIDEQAAAQGLSDEGISVNGKLDANHQAFAADFADEIEFGAQSGETFVQLRGAFANIFEQPVFLDDVEKFQRGGADQRSAAKGSAMQAGRNASGYRFGSQDCAQRQARGERLGDQNDVRLRRKLLVAKIAAGASEAALNFVGDEQTALLHSQGARAVPESSRYGVNSALALDGLENYGTNRGGTFCVQVGHIIETHKFDARNQRREGQAILFGGCDTDGAEGTPVKGILHRQNAVLCGRAGGRVGGRENGKKRQLHAAGDSLRVAH